MEFNIWEVEEVPAVQGCHHLHSGCEECICHPIVERRMDRTAGGVHNSGTFSGGYRGDKWRGVCYSTVKIGQPSLLFLYTKLGMFGTVLFVSYNMIWVKVCIVLSLTRMYRCWGCTIHQNLIKIRNCVSKCDLIQLLKTVILVYAQFLFGKGP